MRWILTLLAAWLLVLPGIAMAQVGNSSFQLSTDEQNAGLPTSLKWKGQELLDTEKGLHWFFTSFEFRNKFYRDENRHSWAGQKDPRFATDVGSCQHDVIKKDGFTTARTSYTNSFAAIERRIMIHDAEPRVRIEYSFKAAREIVIHEPDMFGISLRFDPAWGQETIPDLRQEPPAKLTIEHKESNGKRTGPEYALSFLNAGPAMFQTADGKTTLIASGTVSGDIPSPVPARMFVIKPDGQFTFAIDLWLTTDAVAIWDAAVKAMKPEQKPYALVQLGKMLIAMKKINEAEAVLLKAAELNKDYATPYGSLAALRRDNSTIPGTITQGEAWIEGAYRQPYNYGYILSGSGFWKDKGLTEEQRRLAVFNLLIAVENTQFYADYYIWAARPFEDMKMYAQACAMYRQALWATDYLPRSEEHKQKFREQCRKKITELEKKLVDQTYKDMPALIPVRVEKKATSTKP